MNILDPPKTYIDFRCALHGIPDDEINQKKRKFYEKANDGAKEEIIKFTNWLIDARIAMILPTEKIEVREADGKKHGRVEEMMIYDIEYWIEGNRIRQKKIYIPLKKDSR